MKLPKFLRRRTFREILAMKLEDARLCHEQATFNMMHWKAVADAHHAYIKRLEKELQNGTPPAHL